MSLLQANYKQNYKQSANTKSKQCKNSRCSKLRRSITYRNVRLNATDVTVQKTHGQGTSKKPKKKDTYITGNQTNDQWSHLAYLQLKNIKNYVKSIKCVKHKDE